MQDLHATASDEKSVETQATRAQKQVARNKWVEGDHKGGRGSHNIEKSKFVARLTALWDV